jgi:hypothetical protein
VTRDETPPHRLTTPEAFPDLDAALAASVIARNASARRRKVEEPEEPVTYAAEPLIDADERSQPHPAAFAGAALGLVLIGLLVFSVVRVSDDSIRPPAPVNVPTSSLDAPTPVAAAGPPAVTPAVTPPTPDVAAPQLEAASPTAVPPPLPLASPPVPAALFNASTVTAQTMIAKPPPPPEPEIAPQDSLRARLHERFPELFPAP